MCSGMSVNAQNQFHDEHAPHNPALHITDEGLSNRARYETHLDSGRRCRSDPTARLAGERSARIDAQLYLRPGPKKVRAGKFADR